MYTSAMIAADSARAIAGYKRRKRVRNGRAYSNAIQILAAYGVSSLVLVAQGMA